MAKLAKFNLAAGLVLLLSLLSLITPISSATASPDAAEWSRVNIPTEGIAGKWILARGADPQHLTMAIDGSLYCYATPSGTSYTLFKSTVGSRSWSHTGNVKDTIVGIATAPDDASTMYYATISHIYKSTDAGSSFTSLPPNPGGAGSNNIEITSVDVTLLDSNNVIAVGTRDTDNSQFGGIYTLDENEPSLSWIDTNLDNYDVFAVAFSPNLAAERQIVAVMTNETDTWVTTKIGSAGWGETMGNARLDKDNSGIPVSVAVHNSAAIALPDSYPEDSSLFVAIDTGSNDGDVYTISGVEAPGSSVATDLNIGAAYNLSNIDVTSLAITGSTATANLLAGAASSAQVYHSTDGGENWTRSTKRPTGESKAYVVIAPDFTSSGKAYAATSGTEGAFSHTTDGGVTWNQMGLIDTSVTTILDLAPSPNHNQDNTLFMLTWGAEHSLWRSLNAGAGWERLFTSALPDVDSISMVKLSPQYGNSSGAVFIVGSNNGNTAIWKSTDRGQSFGSPQIAPFPIDIWGVVNDDTLFVGSYDGIDNLGLVYQTTNSGLSYSTPAVAGSQPLNSIALSPDYSEDETLLIGNTNGWVYWSNDDGNSFEPLPPEATSPPLTGSITVDFDHQFTSNHTVYAASNTIDKGIYRFTIGTSTSWEKIDSPTDGVLRQIRVSTNGTLYATNAKADGGMERCHNPAFPLEPTFETITGGLKDGATLTKLRLCDNQLWSIDTTNIRLMTCTDSLALPITLNSPSDKARDVGTVSSQTVRRVKLEWETVGAATKYEWQLNYDTDFSTVPDGFEGHTKSSSIWAPALEPATTYYWRVRATEPLISPWSANWSFTTSSGTLTIVAPELYSPQDGASSIGIKPLFLWGGVTGADSYEIKVSTTASMANPSVLRADDDAIPGTAWQCNINLNYDTTYYWKVRAIAPDSHSPWSAASAFTTEPPPTSELTTQESSWSTAQESLASPSQESPAPTTQEPPPPLPTTPPQPTITPDWIKYLIGALLLTIVLMLITMLLIVRTLKQL